MQSPCPNDFIAASRLEPHQNWGDSWTGASCSVDFLNRGNKLLALICWAVLYVQLHSSKPADREHGTACTDPGTLAQGAGLPSDDGLIIGQYCKCLWIGVRQKPS